MSSTTPTADHVPWAGSEKLVIAFDIGTFSSAVAVAHLSPNVVPRIRTVSAWPGSDKEMKVRSAIYYDKDLNPKAYAAEAFDEFIEAQAKDEGWKLVEAFKLRLHPSSLSATVSSDSTEPAMRLTLPSLPAGLDIESVYTDFIACLYNNTRQWYEENLADGRAIWDKLAPTSMIVFATPDGWADSQQAVIKTALRHAGILSPNDPEGPNGRLCFVHESEASVHWCLSNSNLSWLKVGTAFTILDAGGSTVDASLYVVEALSPLKLRNVKASDCIQTGGVYMTANGKKLIKEKLDLGTRFNSEDIIADLTTEFETKAKRKFAGGEFGKVMLKLGGMGDTEAASGVLKGRLILDGSEVQSRCFDDVTESIVACAKRQTRSGDIRSKHVLLVGGVGESPFVKAKLRAAFDSESVEVITGDEPTKKAVAEGGLIWYVHGLVVARAVRTTVGIRCTFNYDQQNAEHRARSPVVSADRTIQVSGGFAPLILKDAIVSPTHLTLSSFYRTWLEDTYGNVNAGFVKIGSVKADLSPLASSLVSHIAPGGSKFYKVKYDVGISFGANSLFCKLFWTEGGLQREGPATMVPVAFQKA